VIRGGTVTVTVACHHRVGDEERGRLRFSMHAKGAMQGKMKPLEIDIREAQKNGNRKR